MYKIFHLIRSIHLGGAEIVAFNIVEFCKNKYPDNFEFIIAELHQTQDTYSIEKKKELKSKNITVITLGNGNKIFSLLISPFVLAYHLWKESPDIIHSHTDLPDFTLSETKRIYSIFHIRFPKIVRTIHNTVLWPTHGKLAKYVETVFKDDWIVGVSEGTLESYKNLRKKCNLTGSRHQRVIYNGCAIPQKMVHPFKIADEKINIAFCGRFEDQKGIDVLIERVKVINTRFNGEFFFHIIGSGTYIQEVINLSKNAGNVLVYDAVPNIADKLYAFDFIIIPSRFEGLVLISIEASFSRVPVIASFATGLSETLPDDWPLQFHLEKETELLEIMNKIMNHEYNLETLRDQIYSFVTEKFSHDRMIDAYSKLYLEINE